MCGIVGAYSLNFENVVPIASISSQLLQNRGGVYPQGVGLSTGRIIMRDPGPAYEFYPEVAKTVNRHVIVTGLRYGTNGDRDGADNIPPIQAEMGGMKVDGCHNGQLSYAAVLRDYLESITDYRHRSSTDTESLMAYFLKKTIEKGSPEEGARELIGELEDAAFSVVALLPHDDTLVAFRDSNGYRPLWLYRNDDRGLYALASEDPALTNNSRIDVRSGSIREVEPGEVIVINKKGFRSFPAARDTARLFTPCRFEKVYFGRPDSYHGRHALDRVALGRLLHEFYSIDGHYHVIPDSESGDYAAMGYAEASGKPFFKALPKERYPIRDVDGTSLNQRGFMTFGDRGREFIAGSRLMIDSLVHENDAFITDSVIRGTVILKNLKLLDAMGAKNVHVRVTFPPTTDVCHQGTDFRGEQELIMRQIDPEILRVYKEARGDTAVINQAMQQWANARMDGHPNVASFCYMTTDGFQKVVEPGCMRCLGKEHDGGVYNGTIRLPPFLREFAGRNEIRHF